MKVCFFMRVPPADRSRGRELIERIEAYKQDLDILRHLGFEVAVATGWAEIPADADFYFIYWWQWAFMPIMKNLFRRRPSLITGVFDYRWPTGTNDYVHRPGWQKWMMRFALRNVSANVFVSELECREVSKAMTVNNPVYIPHTVDPLVYSEGRAPRGNFILDVVRMHLGNARRKCLPEVIRAIPLVREKHPEVRFVIAGEKGGDFAEIAALATQLGVERWVDFPGIITREEKVSLMQSCKVYVSPTWYEGFGTAILEAMSCGAPVVSSPAGAVPEVVGDAGLLVDGSSPEAIASAIIRYLDDEAFRQQTGSRARQRAETIFPISRRQREIEKVIAAALGKDSFSRLRRSEPSADRAV